MMEIINEILIEVTQISIFNNNLAGKTIKKFKRLIFLNDIKEVAEYCYFNTGRCYACSSITLRDGSWFKADNDYREVKQVLSDWYKDGIAKEIQMQGEQK